MRVKPTEFRLVAAPLASAPICTSIGSLSGLESVHEFGSSGGSPPLDPLRVPLHCVSDVGKPSSG